MVFKHLSVGILKNYINQGLDYMGTAALMGNIIYL